MVNDIVTVVRCGGCGRDGTLMPHEDRLWCAWCGGWASGEILRVRNARISAEDSIAWLVPVPSLFALQPLRVPAGWRIEYNNGLFEVDPSPELVPEQDRWWLFKQDMLQMMHERRDRLLDLGWYPESDLERGHYGLVVYEGNFRGRLLHEFSTRDRLALVAEIERLLRAVTDGQI